MRDYPVLEAECSVAAMSPLWKALVHSRRARCIRATTLSVLVTAFCGSAHAADDEATIAMARERFKEGVQYFDAKEYDKARAAFLQAYALKRHPAVLLNLAQSELRAGREADAAEHFAQYLREHKEATEAEKSSAESGLAAAKAQVAEISIQVDEEGAAITVDGSAEGTSPLGRPAYLRPGTRTIVARKAGRDASAQITATAGQSITVSLKLRKSVAGAEPPPPPDEERREAQSPAEPAPEESRESTASFSETIDSSSERPPFFDWARESPLAWVGGAIGVLGLGGGATFWIVSQQSYSDADSIASQIRDEAARDGLPSQGICTNPPDNQFATACSLYTEEVDQGDKFKTYAAISAGLGAVAIAGTVVYYFATTPTASETEARAPLRRIAVAPWVGPAAQGVSVVGEF